MNTRTARLLLAILVVFMMLTVINVVVHIFKNDYVTETAVAVSASNSVSFKGVYIRDEKTIEYTRGGVISYAVKDGGRLSKDETAAYVYNDEKQIRINEQIGQIDAEIAVLKKIQNPGTQEVAQPAYLAGLIESAYRNIISDKENGNLEKLRNEKEELIIYLSTMQYVTQEIYNFSDKIASLEAERHSLESQQVKPVEEIRVPESAYFVSYTDGYEDFLNFEKAQTITAAEIRSVTDLNAEKVKNGSIGKLINGYAWKIAGVIEDSKDYFKEGNSIKLYFPSSDNTLDAVIEKVRDGDGENEKVIIIDCSDMSYDFVQHRVETIEIQDDEYKGIRIPREAVYVKENMPKEIIDEYTGEVKTIEGPVPGVYIRQGENVIFKKIDPVFQGDDFIISRMRPEKDYVQLYDDTIVSGLSVEGMAFE
ncbi:MAG: hypothetical protein MJ095_01140 [Oscillospiraceae bacterium]|nr:hypothetical protein [Oscillospiraceae bacterium]